MSAHRAPAAPRRVSNRMVASVVLAVLALMLIVVVIAAAADGSEGGYQLDKDGAAYHDGYQGGFATASGPDWRTVGEHRAYVVCDRAIASSTDLFGEEAWNAAMGCRDGVMAGQA